MSDDQHKLFPANIFKFSFKIKLSSGIINLFETKKPITGHFVEHLIVPFVDFV